MRIILTLDNNNGLSFSNKRQSRDNVLIKYLLNKITLPVFAGSYSAILFKDSRAVIDDDFLEKAGDNAYCFIEREFDTKKYNVNEIILCKWNRVYPADRFFVLPDGYNLIEEEDITGSSHEKITILRYVKNETEKPEN